MLKAGRISKETADKYLAILAHPTIGRVTEIAKRLQPTGSLSNKDAAEISRIETENAAKLLEYSRETMTLQEKQQSDNYRVVSLQNDLKKLKQGTIEYAKTELELTQAKHDLDLDNKNIAIGNLEIQRKINEEQKIVDEARLHISEMEQREREKFMPSVEELAKHGGIGGHMARQIERLERHIKRDFFRGDVGAANADIASRNRIYDSLAARGLTPERTELRELRKINDEMKLHLKAIAEGTAILKAKIAMR